MHLASASGVLTWGLFKVTAPQTYAPYGGPNRGWILEEATPALVASTLQSTLVNTDVQC